MAEISRRMLLISGAAAGTVAVAAAAGYGLVEAGDLPGKYRLGELLGACSVPPPPLRGPLPAWHETRFWSRYRRRPVRMITLIPAAAAAPGPGHPGRGLGVIIGLHGLGGDAAAAARLYGPGMTSAQLSNCAVITVDGGGSYWHPRADGDDPLAMIVHEVLPRAAASGLRTSRIGIAGYSMGGYGALLLAERLAAPGDQAVRPAAVAAASPAIFSSYPLARAADPGAFDGPGDFARSNVLTGLTALADVPAWIGCGSNDPFAR